MYEVRTVDTFYPFTSKELYSLEEVIKKYSFWNDEINKLLLGETLFIPGFAQDIYIKNLGN